MLFNVPGICCVCLITRGNGTILCTDYIFIFCSSIFGLLVELCLNPFVGVHIGVRYSVQQFYEI